MRPPSEQNTTRMHDIVENLEDFWLLFFSIRYQHECSVVRSLKWTVHSMAYRRDNTQQHSLLSAVLDIELHLAQQVVRQVNRLSLVLNIYIIY